MAGFEIKFEGLDELQRDVQRVLDTYPDKTENAVMKVAKEFITDTTGLMPGYYSSGKRPLNSPKEWERKREDGVSGMTVAISVRCKAPHFHLVENGHAKWINGHNTGGFVAGRHYVAKSAVVYDGKMAESMRKHVDKILREQNL